MKHMKKYNLDIIDIIRILATLAVFNCHVVEKSNTINSLWPISKWTFIFKTPAWGGVWVFFILSGYTNCLSFCDKKYEFSPRGIGRFLLKRIQSTMLPTMIFFWIITILIQPEYIKANPTVFFRMITCSYNGDPGGNGIGVTWYVFTVMRLYCLLPLFYLIVHYLIYHKKVDYRILLSFVLTAGFILRIGLLTSKYNLNWDSVIYKPFYMNLDLFISGIILACHNRIKDPVVKNKNMRIQLSMLASLIVVLSNMYLYYLSTEWSIMLYRGLYPSMYIVLLAGVLICCSGYSVSYSCDPETNDNIIMKVKSKVVGMLKIFCSISFEFYLFHSIILSRIAPILQICSPIFFYFKLLILTGMISLCCAYGFHRAVKIERKKGI